MRRLGQSGFATLEVILMVTVIGILAAVAVPRFEDVTARANTARVQADLSSIDTAIALYEMNETTALSNGAAISVLAKYLTDAANIKPPVGKAYTGTSTIDIGASDSYEIKDGRAVLKEKTAGEFYYKASE